MTTWTDDRVDLLKKLWTEGASASAIAKELGGITRNSVIGKRLRLGLPTRGKGSDSAQPRERKPRRPRDPVTLRHIAAKEAPLVPPDPLPQERMDDQTIPLAQRCTLMDLTQSKCRWPVGDPRESSFFFCGAAAAEGCVYCVHHSRVAYRAA